MGVQVELSEHGAEEVHLKPVAAPRLAEAPDAERTPESDQRRVDAVPLPRGEHVGAPEEDVAVAGIEPGLPVVGEERPERVLAGGGEARGGPVIDGRPPPAVALVTA